MQSDFKMFIVTATLLFHRLIDLSILTSGSVFRLTCLHLHFMLVVSFLHPSPPRVGTHSNSFSTKKMILKEKIYSLCRSVFYPILEMDPWQNGTTFFHFRLRFDINAQLLIYIIHPVLNILQNCIFNLGKGSGYFWQFLIMCILGKVSPPFKNKKGFAHQHATVLTGQHLIMQ